MTCGPSGLLGQCSHRILSLAAVVPSPFLACLPFSILRFVPPSRPVLFKLTSSTPNTGPPMNTFVITSVTGSRPLPRFSDRASFANMFSRTLGSTVSTQFRPFVILFTLLSLSEWISLL